MGECAAEVLDLTLTEKADKKYTRMCTSVHFIYIYLHLYLHVSVTLVKS